MIKKRAKNISPVFYNSQFSINNFVVDFCHDSAKQASLMALTAPKILNSQFSIFN